MLVCSALQCIIDNCNGCNTTRKQRRKRRVTVFTHLDIRWTSGLLPMLVQFLYVFLSFLCSFRPKIRKHGSFAISVFLVLFWLLIFGLLTFPEYLASLFVSLPLLCLFSVRLLYMCEKPLNIRTALRGGYISVLLYSVVDAFRKILKSCKPHCCLRENLGTCFWFSIQQYTVSLYLYGSWHPKTLAMIL